MAQATKIRLMSLAVLALAAITAGNNTRAQAADSKMTDAERAQIESVVHDYIIAHPEVVVDALKAMDARQKSAEAERQKASLASADTDLRHTKGDFVAGNPQGDVTLIEFFDYNCGYCRQSAPVIQSLLADDPKLRIVFKEWPIRGEGSIAASRISLAASRQPKFLAFHFALMATQGEVDEAVALQTARDAGLDMTALQRDLKAQDIDARLAATSALAQSIGLEGTPAFIIGNQLIPGAIPQASFKSLIAQTRKDCRDKAC